MSTSRPSVSTCTAARHSSDPGGQGHSHRASPRRPGSKVPNRLGRGFLSTPSTDYRSSRPLRTRRRSRPAPPPRHSPQRAQGSDLNPRGPARADQPATRHRATQQCLRRNLRDLTDDWTAWSDHDAPVSAQYDNPNRSSTGPKHDRQPSASRKPSMTDNPGDGTSVMCWPRGARAWRSSPQTGLGRRAAGGRTSSREVTVMATLLVPVGASGRSSGRAGRRQGGHLARRPQAGRAADQQQWFALRLSAVHPRGYRSGGCAAAQVVSGRH